MKNTIVLLLFAIVLISCQKDEVDKVERPKQMDFTDLQVGDVFYFQLTEGKIHPYQDEGWKYRDDTLKIEVIDKLGDKYLITETVTPHSAMLHTSENYFWYNYEGVVTNYWEIRNDSIFVEPDTAKYPKSYLMFYMREGLPFNPGPDAVEVKQDGWLTDYPYTESDHNAYMQFIQLKENVFLDLTVAIRNSPMALDGPGSTYFYNKPDGILKTTYYNWWSREGIGWDRIK